MIPFIIAKSCATTKTTHPLKHVTIKGPSTTSRCYVTRLSRKCSFTYGFPFRALSVCRPNITFAAKICITTEGNMLCLLLLFLGRGGGLMVSALDSGLGGAGRGHCVVFLGKALYSHSGSLHPGV